MIINVSEAKAKLSKLIDIAYQGEEIIIARNNLPLVKLVSYQPKPKRQLGLLKGKIVINFVPGRLRSLFGIIGLLLGRWNGMEG